MRRRCTRPTPLTTCGRCRRVAGRARRRACACRRASMGGMIAQVLAARYPQRVRSLTSIMSSSGNPSRASRSQPSGAGAILLRPKNVDDVAQLTDHLMRVFSGSEARAFRRTWWRNEKTWSASAPRLLPCRLGAATACHPRVGRSPATASPHRGADTGDSWPRRPLVPLAAGIDTADNIRGAQLKVIPGMGHDFRPHCNRRLPR